MSVTIHSATPASTAAPSQALPPGARLGEFEVVALLGVGGFGMVYQAFDHQLQRFVAIKEYMPAALAGRADGQSLWVRSSSDEQSFQSGLASFVEEARLLARFDHPSLVKVLRFWEANHTAYMVMPLYQGMTLKQARAHMRTPPPEDWLRTLLWSVTSALRVLHDGQVWHRDISPDNIFLQNQGPPVLLDLGAARQAVGSRKQPAVLKVNYAPLEQYTNAPANLQQGPWSDLYALGAMVHGCLCHDTPQPATQRAVRDRMLPLARVARQVRKQFGVEYSSTFVDAIGQCLALQPQDRPQSVPALQQAMDMTMAPHGLESFDFRAALGDSWVEPPCGNASGVALPGIDTQALSQQTAQALRMAARAPAAAPEGLRDTLQASPEHPRRRRRVRAQRAHRNPQAAPAPHGVGGPALTLWAMAGSAALLAAAAGLWWGQKPRMARQTPDSEIITEWADPAPALQPHAQVGAQPQPHGESAAEPALPQRLGEQAGASTMDGQTLYLRQVAEPLLPEAPLQRPEITVFLPSAPVAARAQAPEPAAPASAPDPRAACATSGFLARPMCIHLECQTAAMATHPVCVQERQRYEDQARQQQYAQ